ncbi:hypothetical protein [Kiloniella sp.]|uniref:hypothetical protein n=1 Tax=Kiloniella sp. TaxID=1938587 RepID=UPI003B029E9A
MKLNIWLIKENKTAEDFGFEIGYTGSALTRVITGTRQAGPKLAQAIFEGTRGEVTPNDLFKFMPPGQWVLDKEVD